jgi:hypothetical protein
MNHFIPLFHDFVKDLLLRTFDNSILSQAWYKCIQKRIYIFGIENASTSWYDSFER